VENRLSKGKMGKGKCPLKCEPKVEKKYFRKRAKISRRLDQNPRDGVKWGVLLQGNVWATLEFGLKMPNFAQIKIFF
jgi:hypothetical protein